MSISQSLLPSVIGTVVLVASSLAQNDGPPPVRSFADSAKPTASSNAAGRAARSAPEAQRYATKNRRFTIPFSLVSSEQVIVEVLLYVSTDRGQHWEQQRRADVRQNEFEFVAPGDGEFWFAVQTLNRNGQRVPAKISQPELIVGVDTVPPTIEARATTDNAGRVVLEWRARDSNLAPESLSVRHRPSGSLDPSLWKSVPVKCTKPAIGALPEDSIAFWPEYDELGLDLEISIRDQAGNQATVPATVQRTQTSPQFSMLPNQIRPRPAAPNPKAAAATATASNGSPTTSSNASVARNGAAPTSPSNPNWTQADDHRSAPNNTDSSASSPTPSPVEWRSVRHSSSGKFSNRGSTEYFPAKRPTIQPISPIAPATESPPQSPATMSANQVAEAPDDPTAKPTMLVADRTESESDREPHSVLSEAPTNPELAGQAIPVKSKRFRLNYQVEAIDPAGVKEVAVWMTRDGGRSWSKLGSIPDAHGPYPVEVDGSGLFGFRLVVISHSGLKSRLPQPGDSADKWVRVDVDSPLVKITSAPNGTGDQAGKLVIHWQVRDDQLALRPIEISYSTRADGPWTTIEKGVRDTGSYAWAVPADAPERVYLRVTARDEAGNQGFDQTSYAVDISNLYPHGRIQSVEPLGD